MICDERETPFGWLVTASLRGEVGLEALLPAERALTGEMRGQRLASFVGGRVALRRALGKVGAPCSPILRDGRGAPTVAAGTTGSISHKDDVAVAIAARRAQSEHVGIDLELDVPLRVDIARRVLREEEQAQITAWDAEARDRRVRETFAVKEAIYKAIDPVVRRYVAFQEVALSLDGVGAGRVTLHLQPPSQDFDVEIAVERLCGPHGEPLILALARASVRGSRSR